MVVVVVVVVDVVVVVGDDDDPPISHLSTLSLSFYLNQNILHDESINHI